MNVERENIYEIFLAHKGWDWGWISLSLTICVSTKLDSFTIHINCQMLKTSHVASMTQMIKLWKNFERVTHSVSCKTLHNIIQILIYIRSNLNRLRKPSARFTFSRVSESRSLGLRRWIFICKNLDLYAINVHMKFNFIVYLYWGNPITYIHLQSFTSLELK